ncbi:MAG: DUF2845 domain-containing protein [Methylobacter sp.]|uniref:DUF2845 domain-containing protein n=1 Tax=Candidatus Methylobacter titanis TaxID=3053457 RepID=A0AA43Q423_9GAMM|nr:DUF2845 domain-containing protein [Candidatus Methylobacter titanis]MDI1293551.1 DUF2845 domain-containing protein [Candidatus Methylobacter titanis]
MKNSTTWILVLSLCSFNALSAMRCGQKLINLGDYKGYILAQCGEPESVETRTKIVGSTLHHPRRTLDIHEYEEIQIEEWVYNFGSYRLQHYLRFENGILKEIRSLGKGH